MIAKRALKHSSATKPANINKYFKYFFKSDTATNARTTATQSAFERGCPSSELLLKYSIPFTKTLSSSGLKSAYEKSNELVSLSKIAMPISNTNRKINHLAHALLFFSFLETSLIKNINNKGVNRLSAILEVTSWLNAKRKTTIINMEIKVFLK